MQLTLQVKRWDTNPLLPPPINFLLIQKIYSDSQQECQTPFQAPMINWMFIHFSDPTWIYGRPSPSPSLAPARSNPLPPIGTDVQTVVDDVDFVAPSSISNHYGRENKKKAGLGIGRYSYKRNLSHKKCLASIYSLLSFRWSCFKSRDLFQSSIATVCSIFLNRDGPSFCKRIELASSWATNRMLWVAVSIRTLHNPSFAKENGGTA